jgi:hypothetical protein
MSFTNYLASGFAGCFLLAQLAGASTILQSSGNSEASEPLGYYAPYAPYGITPTVYAVEWSQTSAFTNVDVTANLFTPGSPGTVDYSLVTAIGPGTSFAVDGIVQGTVTTPINPANVDLFQLSSLGPGTYYLVLDSPVPNTSWQYNFPIQGNYTTANGVTFIEDQWSSGTSINSAYTPGSTFSGTSLPVEFQVTGTAATPEPATWGVTGLAILGAVLFTLGRRRVCQGARGLFLLALALPDGLVSRYSFGLELAQARKQLQVIHRAVGADSAV